MSKSRAASSALKSLIGAKLTARVFLLCAFILALSVAPLFAQTDGTKPQEVSGQSSGQPSAQPAGQSPGKPAGQPASANATPAPDPASDPDKKLVLKRWDAILQSAPPKEAGKDKSKHPQAATPTDAPK